MTSKKLPDIQDTEMDVMNILWDHKTLSAREVHNAIESRDWAYSTTRTVLERMRQKGLVYRRKVHGINVFEPAITRSEGIAQKVRSFADKVLRVDASAVVPLFRDSDLSKDDLRELRRLLKDKKT